MGSSWETVREIGIDAGHRVPEHGSKCRNLHGHRYRVQAVVRGALHVGGEQDGMTLDFGFLKQVMMDHIDAPCDHGLILSQRDPYLADFLPNRPSALVHRMERDAEHYLFADGRFGKLYVIPFTPTAENLARHWYARMLGPVNDLTGGLARLHQVIVWETPNCNASYPV